MWPEPCHDMPERAVIDIEYASPENLLQSEAFCLMLIQIVVQQCRYHIVGRCDGVEVSREMQVYLFHRKNLRISASGCSAFHSEARSERWLTQRCNCLFPDFVQSKRQTDRDCGLADAGFSRGDGRHEDKFAFLDFFLVNECERHLRHVFSIWFQFVLRNPQLVSNFCHRLQPDAPGNLDV